MNAPHSPRPSHASDADAPVPAGVVLRPWRDGDDRALAQVLPDAHSPAQLAARALLRAPGEEPLIRTIVAEVADGSAAYAEGSSASGAAAAAAAAAGSVPEAVSWSPEAGQGVVVGAAAVAASPAHPHRAWVHVEVAPGERGRGLGAALLRAVTAEAVGTQLEELGLRARVVAGSGEGEAFARALGFEELYSTRIVRIDAGALGQLGAEGIENLQVIDTGSVALTQAFAQWYARVNAADPAAEMTLGQVNNRFLSEAAGAHGAALWRPAPGGDQEIDLNRREVTAFAVSFARDAETEAGAGSSPGTNAAAAGETAAAGAAPAGVGISDEAAQAHTSPSVSAAGGEDATELTAGSVNGDPDDLRSLLARLSTETPVVLEVTSEMETESAVVDALLDAGTASVLAHYSTLVRDPQT